MSVFGDYSKYYDLLYQDKDYEAEAQYVDALIKNYSRNACSILEFGCGTGRYTREFARMGYQVHGVDLSEKMLIEAEERCGGVNNARFSHGDMRFVRLGERFDVVAALFHVLSYQTTNQDVLSALTTVKEHLAPGGIAVLDFWYGPAVLIQQPEIRIKGIENDKLKITRIAQPEVCTDENIVKVHYDAFVELKEKDRIEKISESHHMRYFFISDLSLILDIVPLKSLSVEGWMTGLKPDADSWAAVAVLKKQ
ncbi:SAM-dependent methyltransferase [Synergistales bacterium]|nr:SAM-dependent methyltransferase [Synergistales bacterium]